MLKDKLQIFKNFKDKSNGKKNMENLVVFLVLLVILAIAINTIWNSNKKDKTSEDIILSDDNAELNTQNSKVYNNDMEERLVNILSKIDGVGEANVMVSYSTTNEIVPMYNEKNSETITQEADKSGGERTTNQKDNEKSVIYKELGGSKEPVTQVVVSPKIIGVIVTIDGGNNAAVKVNVIQAVEAVTGLAAHKIQVFPRKK